MDLEPGKSADRIPLGPLATKNSTSPDSAPLEQSLSDRFGIRTLRDYQRESLQAVIAGKDTLIVTPTGAGKTLCYMLPTTLERGLVLVVSPLIALMQQQVQKMKAQGVRAASLDSLKSPEEKADLWQQLRNREIEILLVSPERLGRASFREKIADFPLALVAVDEAHCISQWGDHFRTDYRQIGEYLLDLQPCPKMALTATATTQVAGDIKDSLHMPSPLTLRMPVTRENLSIEVLKPRSIAEHLQWILNSCLSQAGDGIVYAPTRKKTEEIARMLRDGGVATSVYHAGLEPGRRKREQAKFLSGKTRVIVATNAFGMGIDKADIRFVFHAAMPARIESYVQEIGRAGRDGLPAVCRLFYGPRDFFLHRFMIDASFPEAEKLKKLHQTWLPLLKQEGSLDADEVHRAMIRDHQWEPAQVNNCFRALARESLWVGVNGRLELDGRFRLGLQEPDPSFWQRYEERKATQMQHLRLMHNYVKSELPAQDFLERHFQ